jgi:hypothetical protein
MRQATEDGVMDRAKALAGALAISLAAAPTALAQEQARPAAHSEAMAALARAVQNPVANLISLPFQNNTNFNYGPNGHMQNVLNIQPVVPVNLNADWNLITRTILPVISQPEFQPNEGTTFGIGATQASFFLSPARPGEVIWGAGAVVQAPTITSSALGSRIWGAGPTFVALTMQGPWVLGGLVNNIWSFGGTRDDRYNTLTLQPFVNYNIPSSPGTYISFSPIVTANWDARSGQQWTVPLGLAVGQVLPIGNQPINVQLGAYYNVVRPDIGPEWQVRFQIALLFPK